MESLFSAMQSHPWITLGIVVFALLSLIVVVITLFYPAEADYRTLYTTEPVSIDSPEFMAMLSGLTNAPILNGPRPRIVNNGDEFVPALIERIDNASSTVNITTFIWTEGEMSGQILDALVSAAKRGVEVRVLVDGFGGKVPDGRAEELKEAGGRFEEYKPIGLSKILEYYKRNHRRAFVIDGRYAFVGGIAVADEWLGDGRSENEWRELMIEVTGEPAQSVQNAFADIWTETTGEVLTGEKFYPAAESPGPAVFLHIVSSPSETSQSIRASLLLSILGSNERLYITNPYLLPDEQTMQALIDRARAGVDVRILVPVTEGWKPILMSQQINYGPLLEAGVRVYEYRWYVHSKTLVADGILSMVGSANIDSRSRILNDENVVVIADRPFAEEMEREFTADLEYAEELSLEKWRDRPIHHKIIGRIAYLFAKQY